MSFRDYITNPDYRRWVGNWLRRYRKIKPPAKPSRRYIDKLVARLLIVGKAWEARRELSMMGPELVPSLVAALQDPRYHLAEWKGLSPVPAPLKATLELLVTHGGEEVVKFASPLAQSASGKVREIAATNLAATGRAETIPILIQLMSDPNGKLPECVDNGIYRAVRQGRAESEFRRLAYDLLLTHCDQEWSKAINNSARTVIALDPARAAVDLADERFLSLSNPNIQRILHSCNWAKILLPETIVRQLLNAALPLTVRPTGRMRSCPNGRVAGKALIALARHRTYDTSNLAQSLLQHENDDLKLAAAEALAILAGIEDPILFVSQKEGKEGFGSLSHEQRVVYCANDFDNEVCNGGLMQFFGNSSGELAAETLAALAELGHKEAYVALDTAIKSVGSRALHPDRDRRLAGFAGRWDELSAIFGPLEKAYWATSSRLRQAMLLYATRHPEHFRA